MSTMHDRGSHELRGLARDVLEPRWRVGGLRRGFQAGIGSPARQAARHLRDLVAATFGRPGGPMSPEDIARRQLVLSYSDPVTRFRVASYAHGATSEVVRRKQSVTFWKAALFAIGAAAMAAWIAWRWQHTTGIDHLCLTAYSAFVLLFSVNAWSAAFHNWQLRTRRLDGIAAWMSRPSQWLPRLPESESLPTKSPQPKPVSTARPAPRRA